VLTSTYDNYAAYRARNHVFCYGKWIVGDVANNKLGVLTDDHGHHFGDVVRWEFNTQIVYGNSRGVMFSEMELVALTGAVDLGIQTVIDTSYTQDGQTWSQARSVSAGGIGARMKRLVWRRQGFMRSTRSQRFRGDSNTHVSFLRLEAILEPLSV
jgi:hypothetical protein